MRRLELTDDKSHKFWEVVVDGDTVTTRWGRIGTNGQVKSKAYKDGATAQRDADKQLAKKVDKGYVEVEVDADAAPLASKAPPPAAPAPKKVGKTKDSDDAADAKESVAEDAHAAESATARPKDDVADPSVNDTQVSGSTAASMPDDEQAAPEDVEPLPDEDTLIIPSSWKARLHPRRNGRFTVATQVDLNKEWRRVVRAAESRGETVPAEAEPKSWGEETLLSIGRATIAKRHGEPDAFDPFVRFVVATLGAVAAIKLVFMHGSRHHHWGLPPGLRTIRVHLSTCDDAEFKEAEKQLETIVRDDAEAISKAAYLMPRRADWLNKITRHESWHRLCPPTADEAHALQTPFTNSDGVAESLVAEFGPDAVPTLVDWMNNVWDSDWRQSIYAVLAQTPGDDAVAALMDVDDPAARRALPDAFKRFPVRCIRLAATRPGLKPQLSAWIAQRPAAADAAGSQVSSDCPSGDSAGAGRPTVLPSRGAPRISTRAVSKPPMDSESVRSPDRR